MTAPSAEKASSPSHLMKLFAERAAADDLDQLMELYGPDAVFEPRVGVVLVGRRQIRAALAEFLELRPWIKYTTEAEVLAVDDVALASNE